jgi:hypothetical protein
MIYFYGCIISVSSALYGLTKKKLAKNYEQIGGLFVKEKEKCSGRFFYRPMSFSGVSR